MRRKRTWRDLLDPIIANPSERVRLAKELGVHAYTPWRWVSPDPKQRTTPRRAHLRRLPDLFPQHRAEFRQLLLAEFPDLFPEALPEEPLAEIPSLYYRRIISALRAGNGLETWAIYTLGLQQLATQLVSVGETLVYILTLTPSRRSLFPQVGMLFEQRIKESFDISIKHLFFLGADSVPGEAVRYGQEVVHETEMAFPFRKRGRVCGCLWIVMSNSSGWSQAQRDLVGLYADLIMLAFEEHAFCAQTDLHLQSVPPREKQQELLLPYNNFNYRLILSDPTRQESVINELEEVILKEGDQPHG